MHYPNKYSNVFVLKHVKTFNHLKDFLSIKCLSDVELFDVNNDFIEMFEEYLDQFNRPNDTTIALKCVKSVCFIQMHTSVSYLNHPLISIFANDLSKNVWKNQKSTNIITAQLELFKTYSLPQ